MRFADVIVPVPIDGEFTYSIPESFGDKVCFGVMALVPFGAKKTYWGVVARVHDNEPLFDYKDIMDVAGDGPMVLPVQYELWQWIASYYMAPIGDVVKAAMPARIKQERHAKPQMETYIRLAPTIDSVEKLHQAIESLKRSPRQLDVMSHFLRLSHWDTVGKPYGEDDKGEMTDITHAFTPEEINREELLNASHANINVINNLVKRGFLATYQKEVRSPRQGKEPSIANMNQLNDIQNRAYNAILQSMAEKRVTLLHGVTSCGKTEIYIHLIQREIERGRQVLYLLPEIALTVQMTDRLKRVFGKRIAIYHSKYNDTVREEIWRRQMSDNPYDIILGARSAVFLPFKRLGLVIVDEEHETSFKQQEPSPRYHARSVAIMLAVRCGAAVVLGSATPCVESFHNAQTGKYGYVSVSQRYGGMMLPEYRVVDIKDLKRRRMMTGPFSPQLLGAMREALGEGRQVMLFQNRRGFSPRVECHDCGWVPHCQHCDVSLTFHKNVNQLTCHYCGYTYTVPAKCPNCGGTDLRDSGYGTEKIEDRIVELFPQSNVARMDLDTAKSRDAYARIISDFSEGRTNILIGTQMISKGLDFGNVGVVGILNADAMLAYPDFRAYERAFLMMAQVGGRAGRKGRRGLVVVQTHDPSQPLMQRVVAGDYLAMYNDVVAERRQYVYPPFVRLIYVYLRHPNAKTVSYAAKMMAAKMRASFGGRVTGPAEPAVARVKNMHIRLIALKLDGDTTVAKQTLMSISQEVRGGRNLSSLQVFFDVDPE